MLIFFLYILATGFVLHFIFIIDNNISSMFFFNLPKQKIYTKQRKRWNILFHCFERCTSQKTRRSIFVSSQPTFYWVVMMEYLSQNLGIFLLQMLLLTSTTNKETKQRIPGVIESELWYISISMRNWNPNAFCASKVMSWRR